MKSQYQDEYRTGHPADMKIMIALIAAALFMVLCMAAASTSENSDAEPHELTVIESEGIFYQLYTDEHAEVTSSYLAAYSGDIVLKSTLVYDDKTYDVTAVGSYAFDKCTDVTSVDLGNITVIKQSAFVGCTGLRSIDLSNVTVIKDGAFMDCTSLTSIDLTNVTTIGAFSFENTGLTSIDLKNLTEIPSFAFAYCKDLTTVNLRNVSSIDSGFYKCVSLTEFTIDSGNTNYKVIDDVLFSGDGKTLLQYTLGKTGPYTVPDDTETIDMSAFSGCAGLTSVDLKNVTTVEDGAFSECTGLKTVNLNKVVDITDNAFSGCTALTEFTIDENNTNYTVIGGVLFSGDGKTLIQYPSSKTGSYTIPNDIVTTIESSAFNGCKGLTAIDLKNVTTIEDYAFENCTGLTAVDLKNVTTVRMDAFKGCTGLTAIDLKNVTTVDSEAFYGCTGLTAIELKNVTTIYQKAFYMCTNLQKFEIDSSNTNYKVIGDVLFSGDGKTLIQYPSGKTGSYTIPNDDVTTIKANAFYGCTGLTAIDLKNVTAIGNEAFYGCTGLTAIDLTNVSTVGWYAFENCTGLTDVDLTGVSKLREYAFKYCTGLTSIDLKNVSTMGEMVFFGCTGLTSVNLNNATALGNYTFNKCTNITEYTVNENNTVYSAIDGVVFSKDKKTLILYPSARSGAYTVPDSVTSIAAQAFYGCTGLTAVDLKNVTSLGQNSFGNCSGLSSVDLKNVTSADTNVFRNCTNLASVNIGEITNIKNNTFGNCSNLLSVTFTGTAPSITGKPFIGCPENVQMIVPTAAGYTTETAWDAYGDKIYIDISYSTIEPIADQTYTGNTIEPTVTVTDGSTVLTKDVDYIVTYENNINAGTATVNIAGLGAYTGVKSANFTIVPKAIKPDMVPDVDDQKYTGKAIKPVVVKDGDKILVEGTDYTIAYTGDLVNTGAVFYNVTGKGNYNMTVGSMFEIVKAVPSKEFFDYKAPSDLSYDGNEKFATVTLKDGITGTGDYVVTYSDNINVGTCVVTVAVEGGSNMEAGTFEIGTFVINEDNKYIAGATVCIVLVVAFVVLIGLTYFMYRPKKP